MLCLSMEFQTLSDPFDSRHRIPKDQCQQTLLSFSRTHMSWWQTGVSEGVVPQPHLSRLVLQNCPSPKGTRLERSQYRRGSAQGAHLEPLASKSPLEIQGIREIEQIFPRSTKGTAGRARSYRSLPYGTDKFRVCGPRPRTQSRWTLHQSLRSPTQLPPLT